jgi:hypothetical protein
VVRKHSVWRLPIVQGPKDEPSDHSAGTGARRVNNEVTGSGVAAWIPDLCEFNRSCESGKPSALIEMSAVVSQTECDPVAANIARCSMSCGAVVVGL